jgi:hypothetical protein
MDQLYELFWKNNSLPGKGIILLIFILGFVALLCAFRHYWRYQAYEMRALGLVRRRLTLEIEANPKALIQLEALQEPVKSGNSLIADRLATISKMRQANVKVNVDSLQQMSLLKESANFSLAIPGYVVGLAMMLGLLGTFLGLALMAQTLQVLSESSRTTTLPAIRRDLGEITKGLKTGFSPSLLGLACSITVSACNFALARGQSRFYDELERFTAKELLPKTVPAAENNDLLEEVSQRLNNGFARIETITQEHTQNIQYLKSIEEAFGQIIENIKQLTHREAGMNNEDVINSVTGVIQQLTSVNQTVVTLTQHIPMLTADFRKTQEKTLNQLGTVLKTQQDRMESLFTAQHEQLQKLRTVSRSPDGFSLVEPYDRGEGEAGSPGSQSFIYGNLAKGLLVGLLGAALLLLFYWL